MSLARKGSLKSSKSGRDGLDTHKAKSSSASSLPTPTNRSSTLPSRLSLRGLFKPADKAQKNHKSIPIAASKLESPDKSKLPVSSSLPILVDSHNIPSPDGIVLPPTSSHPSPELQRAMSPSAASLKSNHSSLLPRPNLPRRSSSVKRSQSTGPSEGGWFGQKEASKLGQHSRSPSDSSLVGLTSAAHAMKDVEVAEEGAPSFSAILQPDDAAALPSPLPSSANDNYLRHRLDSTASLDAVGRKSTNDVQDLSLVSDTLSLTPAMSEEILNFDSHDDAESLESPAWTHSLPTSSTEHSRAPSAMATFLREEATTSARQSPTARQPVISQSRSYSTLRDNDEPVEIPASGFRSPLDSLVYDLGGRPMSRASSLGHASLSDQGPPVDSTAPLLDRRTTSLETTTDSTSIHDMEREIRDLDFAKVPLPPNAKRDGDLPNVNGLHEVPVNEDRNEWPEQQRYRQQLHASEGMPSQADEPNDQMETLEVTPTTLKRWSMNEMEQSFRNMQNMLGSSRGSTFTLAAVSEDGRQTPSSSSVIIDRALIGLAADSSFEASDIERLSAVDSDSPADSPRRPFLQIPMPARPDRPPKSPERQFSANSTPTSPTLSSQGSVDDEATLLPGHFPTGSSHPSLMSISAANPSVANEDDAELDIEEADDMEPSSDRSRRHTLDGSYLSQELIHRNDEGAEMERAATATPISAGRISAAQPAHGKPESAKGPPPRLNRMSTGDTTTTADGDEELGWATPRTSISPTGAQRASIDEARLTPTMRSRIGQRWQAERERAAASTSESSDAGSRTASGGEPTLPLRSNGSHRVPADLDSSRRRTTPARRNIFAANDDNKDSWFNDTPGRQRFRPRGALPARVLSERESRSNMSADDSEHTISDIRRADKVQLFLRFSQVQAELDAVKKQSALEREALLDALNESRDVVHDLRSERNRLHTRLEKETASLRALSAALGGEDVTEDTVERLADLARLKTVWQQRAQKAASELERHREDIARLEATIENAKDRDEDSRQEIRHLEHRIETLSSKLEEAQDALRSFSPDSPRRVDSPRANPSAESSPSSAKHSSPIFPKTTSRSHVKSSSADASPPRSRLAAPRAGSALGTALPSSLATAPASRLPSGIASPRARTVSTASVISSTASLDAAAAAQSSSTPLHRTKMALVPPTPASPPSPARVSKIPGPRTNLPTRLPSSGLPSLAKSKASPTASPSAKSGLPRLGGSTASPSRGASGLSLPHSHGGISNASRESSIEPPSPDSSSLNALDGERRRGPRSDAWPTPSIGSSNGDFGGLAEQDERFLSELNASQ